ncbi:ChrR-like anti-ECFsigma factor [Shimia isoporae]|uniref:ChrR-like anti-ECFsigma factor n=1 Tax=Shimia isoporae TaxID=647720 RepID=A0A4R1NMT3_9RHOB|nr:ChrR family anti-sigma-E factor [Shimia isoporae]TCL09061.1 ChrR-like anti-ECFsigma factor [Shimia isoporae]
MTAITHHIPEPLLAAYAAGTLPKPFALVIAAHVSMCDTCRAALSAHEHMGGAVLEEMTAAPVEAEVKEALMAMLDLAEPIDETPLAKRSGVYPGPVMEALKGRPPRWKKLGMGVKQCILDAGDAGSVRLLYIPPGQAVPDHTHGGLELTLVLQGSFSDETGSFGVGDLEVANEDLEHTPVADDGPACICLAATDAPLKFNAFVPRLLQPIFRI